MGGGGREAEGQRAGECGCRGGGTAQGRGGHEECSLFYATGAGQGVSPAAGALRGVRTTTAVEQGVAVLPASSTAR
ncbi:hypothetical protein GCM10009566_05040 [Streptomyces murinus]